MDQLLEVLSALRRVLDLGGTAAWFISENAQMVVGGLDGLLFRTADPTNGGRPFTEVATIRAYTPLVQAAADMALTVVLAWGFYRVMWAHGLRNRHTLRHLLPRACLAAVLINTALPLLQAGIDSANAVSDSVVLLTRFHSVRTVTSFPASDLLAPGLHQLTLMALFAAYVLLAFAYVVRFALLVVLTVLAPVAALLFVLPETQHYAHQWGSLFVATLLMQPLQLLILAVGFGLDAAPGGPYRHIFALAAVYIAFKVPAPLHAASMVGSRAAALAKHEAEQVIHALAKA